MEIIKGNFEKTEEVEVDKNQQIKDALHKLLYDTDLSAFDEMVVVFNSTEGEGTSISTNCSMTETHFLLHFAAKVILDGEVMA